MKLKVLEQNRIDFLIRIHAAFQYNEMWSNPSENVVVMLSPLSFFFSYLSIFLPASSSKWFILALCRVFTVIYIVLDITAPHVWHFALFAAFNIHCSELTAHFFFVLFCFFSIMSIMFLFPLTWMQCFQRWCRKMGFWIGERAAIEIT